MIPPQTLAWIERETGSRITRVESMPDASHTNHHVSVEGSGGARSMLLRRYTDGDLLGSDPWYQPASEVAALRALEGVELPVPRLVAADVAAEHGDVPALLLTFLPGTPDGRPDDPVSFARGLAEVLPAIHAASPVQRAYEPYLVTDGERLDALEPPSWARDRWIWERAFEVAASSPPEHVARFIHRDYHQGNTLWEAERLSGVIDWTCACSGPVGIDLAQMRINLVWEFDLELADAFLRSWREVADDPDEHHPYWDVLDAVDWISDPPAPEVPRGTLERYEAFVSRALAELG